MYLYFIMQVASHYSSYSFVFSFALIYFKLLNLQHSCYLSTAFLLQTVDK